MTVDQGHFGKHVSVTASTTFEWLGDVIPAPALKSVISVGDVVMSAGIAFGTSCSMRWPVTSSCTELRERI